MIFDPGRQLRSPHVIGTGKESNWLALQSVAYFVLSDLRVQGSDRKLYSSVIRIRLEPFF